MPPCYKPDSGDGECAYQIYGSDDDEPIERCKACPLCYSDKMRHNAPKTPCDLCLYNPPSSGDGKPCTMCPASALPEPLGESVEAKHGCDFAKNMGFSSCDKCPIDCDIRQMPENKEYIEREASIARYDAEHVDPPGRARELMVTAPAADVVSKGLYEQIKWERDVALAQLEEYGVSLGEKADVVEVRHGRWICINKRYGEYECSVCHGADSNCSDYYGIHAVTEQEFCPSCGAKMDKEETDGLDKR